MTRRHSKYIHVFSHGDHIEDIHVHADKTWPLKKNRNILAYSMKVIKHLMKLGDELYTN